MWFVHVFFSSGISLGFKLLRVREYTLTPDMQQVPLLGVNPYQLYTCVLVI